MKYEIKDTKVMSVCLAELINLQCALQRKSSDWAKTFGSRFPGVLGYRSPTEMEYEFYGPESSLLKLKADLEGLAMEKAGNGGDR